MERFNEFRISHSPHLPPGILAIVDGIHQLLQILRVFGLGSLQRLCPQVRKYANADENGG